jgi:hypothetical protein
MSPDAPAVASSQRIFSPPLMRHAPSGSRRPGAARESTSPAGPSRCSLAVSGERGPLRIDLDDIRTGGERRCRQGRRRIDER